MHTKATTWSKPRTEKPPPPPPPPRLSRRPSGGNGTSGSGSGVGGASQSSAAETTGAAAQSMVVDSDEDEEEYGGAYARASARESKAAVGRGHTHSVAEAIAARATKRKMVETVQVRPCASARALARLRFPCRYNAVAPHAQRDPGRSRDVTPIAHSPRLRACPVDRVQSSASSWDCRIAIGLPLMGVAAASQLTPRVVPDGCGPPPLAPETMCHMGRQALAKLESIRLVWAIARPPRCSQ